MRRMIGLALCAIFLGSLPAAAHHSLAPYNRDAYRTIEGTVRTFEWANPHARLAILVTGPSGDTRQWEFEGGSVGRLSGSGWVKSAVAPGDKITVAYNPKRDGSNGGFFIAVTTPSGTTYSVERFRELKGTFSPERN